MYIRKLQKKIQDLTLDLTALRETHQASHEKHAAKTLELETALKNAQKYRQEDGDVYLKKIADLEAHHAKVLNEMKRNLEHQFDAEKENINSIHKTSLENERSKNNGRERERGRERKRRRNLSVSDKMSLLKLKLN